jgi:hypothetical protein
MQQQQELPLPPTAPEAAAPRDSVDSDAGGVAMLQPQAAPPAAATTGATAAEDNDDEAMPQAADAHCSDAS